MTMNWKRVSGHATAYVAALLLPSSATVLMVVLSRGTEIPNISLLYLPPILAVAIYFGLWPSVLAAAVATCEYDYFLLHPLFTFTIARAQDILAFAVLFIVAIVTAELAAAAQGRAQTAQLRARESTMLYELSQALMSSRDAADVLHTMTNRIVDVFAVDRCAVFVPGNDGRLELAAETMRGTKDRVSQEAARYAYSAATGVTITGQDPQVGGRLYIPLRSGEKIFGVMEIGRKRTGGSLDPDEQRVLHLFAAQAVMAIDKAESDQERSRLRVIEESDRLKSALLSAVSHDLRTPLASIKASASGLLLPDSAWTESEARELLETIDEEADRLNRLVSNLLDLSRIEAGALRPILDWYEAEELAEPVAKRARAILGERALHIHIEEGLPAVRLDLARVEALVINLVENAAKYSAVGSPVELRMYAADGSFNLSVIDHGVGVPAAQRQQIFKPFYQGRHHSDRHPGSGLGLAICKGIAEAHGGRITLHDTPGGGATFILSIPTALSSRVTA